MTTSSAFLAKLDIVLEAGETRRPESLHNLRRLKVTITHQPSAQVPHVNYVPLPPATGPQAPAAQGASGPPRGTPPTSADVFLQVWQANERGQRHESNNVFLVEIPGFIEQTAAAPEAYAFRVLGTPTLGDGRLDGVILALQDGSGAPWPDANGFDFHVSEETQLNLACTLETSAGTRAHATTPWHGRASFLPLDNLRHALRTQVEEGGITCGFWADLNTPNARHDLADYRQQLHDHPTTTPRMTNEANPSLEPVGPLSGKKIKEINNDAEFPNAGGVFADRYHSIGLHVATDGVREVCIGSTSFQGTRTSCPVSDMLGEIRSDLAAQPLFRQLFPALGATGPLVRTLAIFTHGDARGGLRMTPDGDGTPHRDNSQWFSAPQLSAFANALAPNLADDALVGLYACWTGTSPAVYAAEVHAHDESKRRHDAAVAAHDRHPPPVYTADGDWGEVPDTGFPGAGAFAEVLCQHLVHDATPPRIHVAVMAHTTYGHTYGNGKMRFFTGEANADSHFMTRDDGSSYNQHGMSHEDTLDVSLLRPQAAVRRAASNYHATLNPLPGAS